LLLAALWLALIWQLSSLPSRDEPRHFAQGWLANSAHAPLFGLLALWCALALPRADGWPRLTPRSGCAIVLFVLGYGILDELHQSTVAGRDASSLDILTDVVGAICTLWLASYAGAATATARGVGARLAAGLAACALAGLAATLF
jgi:VanZ family protein